MSDPRFKREEGSNAHALRWGILYVHGKPRSSEEVMGSARNDLSTSAALHSYLLLLLALLLTIAPGNSAA